MPCCPLLLPCASGLSPRPSTQSHQQVCSYFHDNFCWIMDKQGSRIIACRIVSSTRNLYAITSFILQIIPPSSQPTAANQISTPLNSEPRHLAVWGTDALNHHSL